MINDEPLSNNGKLTLSHQIKEYDGSLRANLDKVGWVERSETQHQL